MGVENHVRRSADGYQPHQGNEPHGIGVDMAQTQSQCAQDQGEFANLRHRQTGQKPSSLTVTHGAKDNHYNQRIAN